MPKGRKLITQDPAPAKAEGAKAQEIDLTKKTKAKKEKPIDVQKTEDSLSGDLKRKLLKELEGEL